MRRRRGLAVITALAALGAGSAWLTWQKNTPEASEGARQPSGRRQALSTATAGAASLTERAEAAEAETEQPLTYCGGGFCTSFSLGGRQFRGVVDTGSPFLLVSTCDDGRGASGRSCSSYCSAWGCTTAAKGRPSGLEDTDECFAAGTARVSWRKDSLELGGRPFGSITYGVMLEVESYGGNGGGAFLGLVRDRQARIRPTLVGQTDVRTLSIDLRAGQESLSFSQTAPKKGDGAMVPLVDLRGSGAAVRYYAAEVAALNVGGKPLEVEGPLVAVLDTGTTGLGLPSALFARYDAQRRERAEELGLKAGQAVEILLKAADGGVLPLSLRQGRQAPYESDRFDIVTAIPEPPGIAPDALALWTGDPVGAKRLALREGDLVAEAMEVRASQRGWVQADRPVSQGDRFLVRLVGRTAGRRLMDAAVGLAPRGSRLTAEESAAFPGDLQSGDLVECLLSDDGSGRVLWRINGGKAVYSSQPFETARNVYPTVELGPGAGSVELLSAPAGNSFDEGLGRWARPPSEARARPTVLFLGLGFLLGRKLSIDTVANRAVFM